MFTDMDEESGKSVEFQQCARKNPEAEKSQLKLPNITLPDHLTRA